MLFENMLQKRKPLPQQYVPTDAVQQLAAQGFSEAQIIDQLRKQGFSPAQVDSAITQALKSEVAGPQPPAERPALPAFQQPKPPLPQLPPLQTLGMTERFSPPEKIITQEQAYPLFTPQPEQPQFTFEEPQKEIVSKESLQPEITLEEVIEGIIADRWVQFDERLNAFEQRDLQLQQQLDAIRAEMENVRKLIKSSEGGYSSKLEDFGEHVTGIESRIGSIEKAFKDFLPELTDNIRIMAEVVEKVKKQEKA